MLWLTFTGFEIPEFDCSVQRACDQTMSFSSIPVDSIYLSTMGFDGTQWIGSFAIIPDS